MKKIFLISTMVLVATSAMGQTPYANATTTNTNDVIGTARYVGMGGALGALGADISVMSSNPAGIGLYRKNDVALTAGANWPADKAYGNTYNDKTNRATLDQAGFVWTMKHEGSIRNMNIGFNYQKKANYNSAFLADNNHTNGLSQMDQVAELADAYGTNSALTSNAWESYLIDHDDYGYYNGYGTNANGNQYAHYTTGSLRGYDFNFSFNVKDRAYFGLTLGLDQMRYNRRSEYTELRDGDASAPIQDYTIYDDQEIRGSGVNVKFGTIVRPIADNSFRIGLAIETPTWYSLKSSTLTDIYSKNDSLGYYPDGYLTYQAPESYIEYDITTPWKVRLSLGQTVGTKFAWGFEYEYANESKIKQSYDDSYYDDWGGYNRNAIKDYAMNDLTKSILRGQHTLKMGVEVKPVNCLALRAGYNFISSPYKSGAHFDQYDVDSYALDYNTETSYMNLSSTNILTLGIGYKYKRFYVDLAYKYRHQTGDFYAFDTSFTQPGSQFAYDNPDLAGAGIEPVDVNLSRHNLTATIGFKF